MTRREIAELACKLMALYLFVNGLFSAEQLLVALLPTIGEAVSFGFRWHRFAPFMTAGSYVAALFAPAALLWWQTEYFARRMVVDDSDPVTAREWNAETLTSIGFVVIGMNAVIQALQLLLTLVISEARDYGSIGSLMGSQWGVSFAIHVCHAILGIWLMLGSRGLSRVIMRMRTGRPGLAALPPESPPEIPPPDEPS